jgi:hypothetical protein
MTHVTDGSPLSLDRLVQTNLFKSGALAGASVQETHIEPRVSTLPPNQEQWRGISPAFTRGPSDTASSMLVLYIHVKLGWQWASSLLLECRVLRSEGHHASGWRRGWRCSVPW